MAVSDLVSEHNILIVAILPWQFELVITESYLKLKISPKGIYLAMQRIYPKNYLKLLII